MKRQILLFASCLIGWLSSAGCKESAKPEAEADHAGPCTQAQCTASGKRCSLAGTCVSCILPEDCAAGATCVAGACIPEVPCTATADCEGSTAGLFCDAAAGHCVPCLAADDCGPGFRCVDRACQADVAPRCTTPADCPSPLVCDIDLGRCAECVTVADCPEGEICVSSLCTDTCIGHENCAADQYCYAGGCLPDLCRSESTRCDPASNAVLTCSSIGNSYNATNCGAGTSCSDDGAGASCIPWRCTPGEVRCSEDATRHEICRTSGLEFRTVSDCTLEGNICENATCAPVVCQANTDLCEANVLKKCNPLGTFASVTATCTTTEHCDAASATCVANTCAPETARCQGNTPQTCDSIGSAWIDGDPCQSDEACVGGSCRPVVCEASARYCKGPVGAQDVYECNRFGTGDAVSDDCSANEYCGDENEQATCLTRACSPGQEACHHSVFGTCNAEGSGLEPGGTDCSLTDQACYAARGGCVDRICDPATPLVCDHEANSVMSCLNDGARIIEAHRCMDTEYCVGTSSNYCDPRECEPDAPLCDGNTSTRCNEIGSGPTEGGTDCTETDQVCVQGVCLDRICTPSSYFCDGTSIFQCGPTGATSTHVRDCTGIYFCEPGLSTCRFDVCTANTTLCDGNRVTTCLPDGSGPSPETTADCGVTNQACEGGACRDVICSPNDYFCSGGDVRRCNGLGTGSSPSDTCGDAEYCDDQPETALCRYDICIQAVPGCNGEAIATCNADGSGFESAGTPCTEGQVCSAALGSCADQAIDTIGATSTNVNGNGYLLGNSFSVTTSRTLVTTEIYGTALGTPLFTWFVYEAMPDQTSYTLIDQRTTATSGSNAFFASPTLNVDLVTGRTYFIGVHVAGTFSYQRATDGIPDPTSFGRVEGGQYVLQSGVPESLTQNPRSVRVYQRLTTDNPQ